MITSKNRLKEAFLAFQCWEPPTSPVLPPFSSITTPSEEELEFAVLVFQDWTPPVTPPPKKVRKVSKKEKGLKKEWELFRRWKSPHSLPSPPFIKITSEATERLELVLTDLQQPVEVSLPAPRPEILIVSRADETLEKALWIFLTWSPPIVKKETSVIWVPPSLTEILLLNTWDQFYDWTPPENGEVEFPRRIVSDKERQLQYWWDKFCSWVPKKRSRKIRRMIANLFTTPSYSLINDRFAWAQSKPADFEERIKRGISLMKPLKNFSFQRFLRLGANRWPKHKLKSRLTRAERRLQKKKGRSSQTGHFKVVMGIWEGFITQTKWGKTRKIWVEKKVLNFSQLDWMECVEQAEGDFEIARSYFRNQTRWVTTFAKSRKTGTADWQGQKSEQTEKKFGFQTNGVKRPRWMNQEEFNARMSTGFGQAISTEADLRHIAAQENWFSTKMQIGLGNPDLTLKFGLR